ncbi:hypothetical protein F8388_007338 [Cannabis sativa]|uniref:MPBQ/MBSQ family SAM-binding methyltransferase profile domain-containing protein n=1 Tax=Cannabis sativa TaxID=3483 RepID=A0A7J6FHU5_CANSA|nr:hypothetical protein F8388_007338 [Cannabis sativa]
MASAMLNGAENLTLLRGITPNGLGFRGSDFHGKHFPKLGLVCSTRISKSGTRAIVPKCSLSASRPASQPRFIQNKKEAFWFYRFLSIVYDHVINPGHWTEDMRDDALEPADLNNRNMIVVDVGGGTGFTTLGIVKHVDAKNVTILDQSPHQLAKAKQKEPLKECKIIEGDAEDLPFRTDYADRYVSAGSIEYWPDPQRGIKEAYRVLKLGGKACLIGPVYPTFWLSRFFADVWMLFPKEEEYIDWFQKAGFKDVQLKRIGPKWYRGVRRHGLIMGCSVTGVKPASGDSPLQRLMLSYLLLHDIQTWSESRRRRKASKSICVLSTLLVGVLGRDVLCAGAYLHVAKRSNCTKRPTYLRVKVFLLSRSNTMLCLEVFSFHFLTGQLPPFLVLPTQNFRNLIVHKKLDWWLNYLIFCNVKWAI